MNDIKRFNHQVCEYPGGIFSEMNQQADGDYVLHSDHEAEIARLRAEVEENEKVINVWRGRTQRAEAEVEAYRKDAERWRFFQTAGYNVTLRMHYTRPDERENAIDAAMGASA